MTGQLKDGSRQAYGDSWTDSWRPDSGRGPGRWCGTGPGTTLVYTLLPYPALLYPAVYHAVLTPRGPADPVCTRSGWSRVPFWAHTRSQARSF